MGRHASIAIRMALITIVIFGVLYPLAITAISQVLFPRQSNGSLLQEQGKVIGSKLIGQQFTRPEYFHPRPSAAGKGYDAAASGGSNLGPTNKVFIKTVGDRVKTAENRNQIPVDMVTSSGSGLDPDISIANAYTQASRVAKARSLSETRIRELIELNVTKRTFGFLGEPRVNVLTINMKLDTIKISSIKQAGI